MQVVVSHYAARDIKPLHGLLRQLLSVTNHICVVINEDHPNQFQEPLPLEVEVIKRPNTGMNLAGWQEAAKAYPMSDLLLLQDECVMERPEAVQNYAKVLATQTAPALIGETINPRWNKSWADLMRDPVVGDRAKQYSEFLRSEGVPLASNATHLRTLAIGIATRFSQRFCSLPVGKTKEQCIALEIGISQCAITEFGGIAQSNSHPFHYFSHLEWRSDGLGKR